MNEATHSVPKIKLTSKQANMDLFIGAYNGSASLTVFAQREPGESGGNAPVVSKNLGLPDIALLRDALVSLDSIPPGNQKAFMSKKMDGDKWVPDMTICVGTDEKGTKYIELQFRDKQNTPKILRFPISMTGAFSDSDKEFNYADKTKNDVKGLIWWLDHVLPLCMYFTNGTVSRTFGGKGGAPAGRQF